jgi:hypothetical protein
MPYQGKARGIISRQNQSRLTSLLQKNGVTKGPSCFLESLKNGIYKPFIYRIIITGFQQDIRNKGDARVDPRGLYQFPDSG